jgi:hypothetical protein
MKFPSKEHVARVRLAYPVGTKVVCISIEDPYAHIPPGTIGEVTDTDDTGTYG